jgi:hypothetical protein
MPSRKAEAEWKGNLMQGGGQLTVGSRAFRAHIRGSKSQAADESTCLNCVLRETGEGKTLVGS